MDLDLSPLLAKAFYSNVADQASEALAEARLRFAQRSHGAAFSFEVAVPSHASRPWLVTSVIGPLVYYCESSGASLPRCEGVFVSLFVGGAIYCIAAADVVAWACEVLETSTTKLVARYGAHEIETTEGPI
jgi:hypothetical protein